MARKLDLSQPLPISFRTEQLHEDLSAYDTVHVQKFDKSSKKYQDNKVFYASTQVYPGDLFTARHVHADGSVTVYSISNPCIINFRTNFDAVQKYTDTQLGLCTEAFHDEDDSDTEITYVEASPPPKRKSLKRTWAKIGADLVDAMTKTDELLALRPAKIQKLN